MTTLKRRHFLIGGAGAAGALIVGWVAMPPRQRLLPAQPLRSSPGESALNGWVKIGSDNSVTVIMAQAEMGQGVHTALPMLVAEELDAAWDSVRLEQAGFDPIYNNQAVLADAQPMDPDHPGLLRRASLHVGRRLLREISGFAGTLGSSSVRDEWLPLRAAGASARLMLLAAAAESWNVPLGECRTAAGRVLHASGRSASYGELAARAARRPLPRHPTLKGAAQFTLIGRPLRRIDNAPKLDGSARFGLDCEAPGLLYASVAMCPTVGGRVARFDARPALTVKGVRKAVVLAPLEGGLAAHGLTPGGVAVIADTPYRAQHALNMVRIEWDAGAGAGLSSRGIFERLSRTLDTQRGHAHLERGDVDAALRGAARVISAEYRVPFLAHATLEPMNATVQFKDGAATVWTGTQAPGLTRRAVAAVLGLPASKVEVRMPFLGGGFGRRYLTDCVRQAAALARETAGAPVQLMWSREQDIAHDYYRPACIARCQAGLDAGGRLVAWKMTSAGSSSGVPWFADASTDGASNTAYAFPNARVAHQGVETAVPIGIWRSVSHSQNAFFVESFIDEAAAAAGEDPLRFRERLLAGNAAQLRVLRRAAALCGWEHPPAPAPDGARCARGIALHRCYGSLVAEAAEVSLGAAREIRVHRVVCVIDCGVAVNPNLVRQQLEGGIVDGLAAALHGEITLENGQVQQSNFHDYVPLRMYECPQILTEIIADGSAPGGVGETAVPPIAPAVANAVFALTGERLRALPLRLG